MNKALQPSPSTKNSEEQHQKCTFWGLYIFCSLDPWPLPLHLSGKNGVKISNIFICLFRKIAGDLVNQSAPCLSKLSTPAAWLNLYSRVKKTDAYMEGCGNYFMASPPHACPWPS